MYLIDTFSIKNFTLFYSIGDFPLCLLVFALLVLPVRSLPPAIRPSDLGTITRESPVLRVLEGRPRCIGRDFDGIFQAAWLAPPWTSQAACGSSQIFFHPFFYVRRTLWRCPTALHQMRATNVRVNMRTILGAIGINEPSAQSSTLPLLSPSSSCSEASDSSQIPSPTFARKS